MSSILGLISTAAMDAAALAEGLAGQKCLSDPRGRWTEVGPAVLGYPDDLDRRSWAAPQGGLWIALDGGPGLEPTDLEALAEGFAQAWVDRGPEAQGMVPPGVALVLVDEGRQLCFAARGTRGTRTLSWTQGPGGLAVATRLPHLLALPGPSPELDLPALEAYLRLGYIPAPATPFRTLRKVPPGGALVLGFDGSLRELAPLPSTAPATPEITPSRRWVRAAQAQGARGAAVAILDPLTASPEPGPELLTWSMGPEAAGLLPDLLSQEGEPLGEVETLRAWHAAFKVQGRTLRLAAQTVPLAEPLDPDQVRSLWRASARIRLTDPETLPGPGPEGRLLGFEAVGRRFGLSLEAEPLDAPLAARPTEDSALLAAWLAPGAPLGRLLAKRFAAPTSLFARLFDPDRVREQLHHGPPQLSWRLFVLEEWLNLHPEVVVPAPPQSAKGRRKGEPRVVFVQSGAAGLLLPQLRSPFGGAEVRSLTFARHLTSHGGYAVAFAVVNPSTRPLPPPDPRLGIEIHAIPGHIFSPSVEDAAMKRFMTRLGADVYISLGANQISHEMALLARSLGVPSLVGLASDQSLHPRVFQGSMVPDEYGTPGFHAWSAMRHAGQVLCQTAWQVRELYRRVGVRGRLLRNPIPQGWEEPAPRPPAPFAYDFFWTGRAQPDKNPEVIFEMARLMPEATFRMVVDGGLASVAEHWRPKLPPNVHLSDRISTPGDMRDLITSARAILNTSPQEGFPNLMLQGAMVGIPTLFLTVDPDDWASQHGCAACAGGDFETYHELLRRALKDEAWLSAMAQRAQARALAFHGPGVVREAFLEIIHETIQAGGA